jgi:hypothetical protein
LTTQKTRSNRMREDKMKQESNFDRQSKQGT